MGKKEKDLINQYLVNFNPKLLPIIAMKKGDLKQTPSFGIFCSKIQLYDHRKIDQENYLLDEYQKANFINSETVDNYTFGYECLKILSYRQTDLEEAIFHSENQNKWAQFWEVLQTKIQEMIKGLVNKLEEMKIKYEHISRESSPTLKKLNFITERPKEKFLLKENAKKIKKKFDQVKEKYIQVSKENSKRKVKLMNLNDRFNFTEGKDRIYENSQHKSRTYSQNSVDRNEIKFYSKKKFCKRSSSNARIEAKRSRNQIRSSIFFKAENLHEIKIKKNKTVRLIEQEKLDPTFKQIAFSCKKFSKLLSQRKIGKKKTLHEFQSLKNIQSKSKRKIQQKFVTLSLKSIKSNNPTPSFRELFKKGNEAEAETYIKKKNSIDLIKKKKNIQEKKNVVKNSLLTRKKQELSQIAFTKKKSNEKKNNRRLSVKKNLRKSFRVFDLSDNSLNMKEKNGSAGVQIIEKKGNRSGKENRNPKDIKKPKRKRSSFVKIQRQSLNKMKESLMKSSMKEYEKSSSSEQNQNQHHENPHKVDVSEFQTFREKYVKFHNNIPSLQKKIDTKDNYDFLTNSDARMIADINKYKLKKIEFEDENQKIRNYQLNRKIFAEEGKKILKNMIRIREMGKLSQRNLTTPLNEISFI